MIFQLMPNTVLGKANCWSNRKVLDCRWIVHWISRTPGECVEAWHMCLVCPTGFGASFCRLFPANIQHWAFWQDLNHQPTCVQGSKILGWSSTLSIIWLRCDWLRIWGVFNPPVTYGVTLWSGVWGASLTLLGGRWALVRWRIMGACHRHHRP